MKLCGVFVINIDWLTLRYCKINWIDNRGIHIFGSEGYILISSISTNKFISEINANKHANRINYKNNHLF
jgi:hypothetical protein